MLYIYHKILIIIKKKEGIGEKIVVHVGAIKKEIENNPYFFIKRFRKL